MATRLIELEDGILVEVEAPENQPQQISSKFAEEVNSTFDKLHPILVNICRPLSATWKEISKDMEIEQAEVELGLNFEIEGNLYITKSKANSNLKVKLVLKPKEQDE